MLKRKTTILILCPYPTGQAPSQRFRFEQYFGLLAANGFETVVQPFFNESTWAILYKKGNTWAKMGGMLSGFFSRCKMLTMVHRYDFVFVHREATPIGPPIFEWVISKIFQKKIIFDFDDAIWLPNTSQENSLMAWAKWHSKTKSICRWSYKISAGNEYLCSFARQFNPQVILNPTTIDTENAHNPNRYFKKRTDKIVIGWTGTHSTLKYLNLIEPVFDWLQNKFGEKIELQIIADREPKLKTPFRFVPWIKDTEMQDLTQFDIGLMPLPDDQWACGKCGFKALQYMALQIPTIASPVGVNTEIIQHGENGFLCNTPQEWEQQLSALIENESLRNSVGMRARKKIVEHYSVSSNSSNFLSLFS